MSFLYCQLSLHKYSYRVIQLFLNQPLLRQFAFMLPFGRLQFWLLPPPLFLPLLTGLLFLFLPFLFLPFPGLLFAGLLFAGLLVAGLLVVGLGVAGLGVGAVGGFVGAGGAVTSPLVVGDAVICVVATVTLRVVEGGRGVLAATGPVSRCASPRHG